MKVTRKLLKRWAPRECPGCGDEALYVDADDHYYYNCDFCDYTSEDFPITARGNASRRSRRTDFGRWRSGGWFVGGRSLPVVEVTHAFCSVLAPGCPIPIIGASLGMVTDRGRIVAISHPGETLWVTP